MTGYWERVEVGSSGVPALRATGAPVAEVVRRLEAAEPPAALVQSLQVEPIDLIAALARDALGEGDGAGPALTQAAPRRPRLAGALDAVALADLFPSATRPARLALSAGLLLVHDFWDASHRAAQEAGDLGEARSSAYWHGLAHRREPDAGNAAYWFRRVGTHPVFPSLADAARPLIDATEPALAGRLLPRGAWDPFAFIDVCTRARGSTLQLAVSLQRLEMILLLGAAIPV
jgi:hypothetical protein